MGSPANRVRVQLAVVTDSGWDSTATRGVWSGIMELTGSGADYVLVVPGCARAASLPAGAGSNRAGNGLPAGGDYFRSDCDSRLAFPQRLGVST